MAAEKFSVVLWLIPAEPANGFFRETIARLAAELDAPFFAPHLTLGLGSIAQLQPIHASALELPVVGIDYSGAYTKTLFVRLGLTQELLKLRDSLGMERLGFDPHLSLLYREMPLPNKKQLAGTLSIPFDSVLFEKIAAVRCAAETRSREDVKTWQELKSKELTR